ncbi:MAG: 2-oxoacid:ferredoxin oxidoreductase subunit beta [Candidatus Korarchaeota archaeon]|nr:2-oxoacid:ferredoxin oxidoreductase subunit beta [Candidatus Korarchaeota archaeon]NIU83103.1 2-oxoacid:ferredoxin oxidoreductase subunit beta [Candidatus Thorarchaeota archaeon]NIW13481.1 2-oxoacid:ferredoxin oxidoreductase subunit beta [Candidatus Thorarchaeota archaeon]
MEKWVREDRLPHIWCSGCGIGTMLSAYLRSLNNVGADPKKVAFVSGIGCVGRAPGYITVDAFHTTHGRGIPFAVGLKLARPELHVHVLSGDGDLFSIGGNHFIHAARRNINLLVICSNNFIYGMTGGQLAPTTPHEAESTTSPYGNIEHPFNTPHLADAAGATYVARWTALHARRLEESITEALQMKGFRYIEVLTPCPTTFGRRNEYREGLDMLKYFKDNAKIVNGADTSQVDIELGKEIIVGNFVRREKPTYLEGLEKLYKRVRGESG